MTEKFNQKLFTAHLAYLGLPADYSRNFRLEVSKTEVDKDGNPKTYLKSANVAQASRSGVAVWTQVNFSEPAHALNDYGNPKKPTNQDIDVVLNITLDFEDVKNPDKVKVFGLELGQRLTALFKYDTSLPVVDSGAGCHIELPITPIPTEGWGGGIKVNEAVRLVMTNHCKPLFAELAEKHGLTGTIKLEAFDISRVLSLAGTYRPPNPKKDVGGAEFLANGYARKWLNYDETILPIRAESQYLTDLVIQAVKDIELEEKEKTSKKKKSPKGNSKTGKNVSVADWIRARPKPNRASRSEDFYSLCAATFVRFDEQAVLDNASLIDEVTGGKYQGRELTEAKRCLYEANPPIISFKKDDLQAGTKEGRIIEGSNCYFKHTIKIDKNTGEIEDTYRKLTNFVFEPGLFLKNDVTAFYRGVVHTETKRTFDFELNMEAFVSVSSFNRALAGFHSLSYEGGVSELGALKAHIAASYPDIKQIRVEHTLGLVDRGEGWLLSENQILTSEGIKNSEDASLAYAPLGFLATTNIKCNPQAQPENNKMICELLPVIAEPEAFYAVTGWFFALPFKPLITSKIQGTTRYWPFLFTYGSAGSGKTNLIKQYQELFGVASASVSVTGNTPFSTLLSLGYSQNLPLFLDEYNRKTLENARRCEQLDTHLRDAYNLLPAFKGNLGMSTTKYERFAPVAIAGESFTEDTAIKGRVIAVAKKAGLSTDNIKTFKELQSLDKAHFAFCYAQWSMSKDLTGIKELWLKANQIATAQVNALTSQNAGYSELDRVAANIAVCIFGLEMFRAFSSFCGMEYEDFDYRSVVNGLLSTLLETDCNGKLSQRVKNQADDFIEWCCNNPIQIGQEAFLWEPTGIYVNFPVAFEKYEQARAKTHKGTFSATSIKVQLRERGYVVEKEGQKRLAGQTKRVWILDPYLVRSSGLDIPFEPPTTTAYYETSGKGNSK